VKVIYGFFANAAIIFESSKISGSRGGGGGVEYHQGDEMEAPNTSETSVYFYTAQHPRRQPSSSHL
jgi:hypothetical protein